MKSSYTIPIAIVLGGVIVALAVYFSVSRPPSTPSGKGNPAAVRPIGVNDHILGNPAAKVVIIEYADFDCTYCKGFSDTLHQIVADEGLDGEIAWAFRHFPLIEIHENALRHAEAAECAAQAGGNDAFWKFSDALFAAQPADPTKYGVYAEKAGVPGEAFASCYANASTTVYARVMADRQNALDAGAIGTPYTLIVVPGKAPTIISGTYPYEAIQSMISDALKEAR